VLLIDNEPQHSLTNGLIGPTRQPRSRPNRQPHSCLPRPRSRRPNSSFVRRMSATSIWSAAATRWIR
jgi:hypothetical protein